MGRINSRSKGANGEREAAKWLKQTFKLQHEPERNLEQVRFKGKGQTQEGFDLKGFQPFCFEIKRQEQLALREWWRQAVNASNQEYHVPVVMYRQNRGKWKFLISAVYIGCRNGYIHLEAREFTMFANRVIAGK